MKHLQVPAIQEFKQSLKYLKDFNLKLTDLKSTSIMTLIDIVDYINEENLDFKLTYTMEDIRYYNHIDISRANYIYLLTRFLTSRDYVDTPSHWKHRIIHYIKNSKNLNFKTDIAKIAKDTCMSESDAKIIFNSDEYELTPVILDNLDFSAVMTEEDFYRIIDERFPYSYHPRKFDYKCHEVISKNNPSLYEPKVNIEIQNREPLLNSVIKKLEARKEKEKNEKKYYSRLLKMPVKDLNAAVSLYNNIVNAIQCGNNEYLNELGIDSQEFLKAI